MRTDELMTRNDVTLLEACKEFVAAVKEKSEKFPNPDMKGIVNHYIKLEEKRVVPQVIVDAVKYRNNGVFDVSDLDFIHSTELNVSYPLLAFIASFCNDNPEAITAVLGAYAVVFYSEHNRNSKLTLKACADMGLQDILSPQEIFPYAMNFKGKEDCGLLLEKLTPQDIYIHEVYDKHE